VLQGKVQYEVVLVHAYSQPLINCSSSRRPVYVFHCDIELYVIYFQYSNDEQVVYQYRSSIAMAAKPSIPLCSQSPIELSVRVP